MENDNILIDHAKISDVPALTKLIDSLFAIEVDFQADLSKQTKALTLILQATENAKIFVARNLHGTAIGMVSAQLVISTSEGAFSAWIEDMVIERSYQRSGIGKRLLNEALIWAKQKGATRAQLLVDTENLNAIHYYDRLGWQPTQLNARRISLVPTHLPD